MKTRNGKIARLPRLVREKLNERLERSEPGPQLLDWLNALPEVREILRRDFAGVPVSKQNLSQWRRGGFQESLASRYIGRQTADGLAMLLARSLAGLIFQSNQSAKTGAVPRSPQNHANFCNKDSYRKNAIPASPGE